MMAAFERKINDDSSKRVMYDTCISFCRFSSSAIDCGCQYHPQQYNTDKHITVSMHLIRQIINSSLLQIFPTAAVMI